jgi:Spy/CpxP family protein refolding chaperone
MRELRNGTLALIVLAVCAPPARSDDSDRMVPEEGAIHVMLLRQKCVRDELKLTDDEARKIKEHNDRQWKKAQEIHKLTRDERHSRYEELSQENERFLDQVLEPSERKRLEEISLQVAGLLMATSPKFASQLGLTDQQKQQLARHQDEARAEMADVLHSKTREGREEKLHELRKTSRKRLMDVLTDEQEAKWKEMVGTPFEAKFKYDTDEEGNRG